MSPARRRSRAPSPPAHATTICPAAGALTVSRTWASPFPAQRATARPGSILAVVRRQLLLERSELGERRVRIDRPVALARVRARRVGPQRRPALVAAALVAEIAALTTVALAAELAALVAVAIAVTALALMIA